jgi:hypothetical protein
MNHIKFIFIAIILLFYCNLHSQKIRESIQTSYGVIKIITYSPYSSDLIVFNGSEIFKDEEIFSLYIKNIFNNEENDVIILIEEAAGSAAFFRVISLKSEIDYWISERFGTRNDLIEVEFNNSELKMKIPYIYDFDRERMIYYVYIYKDRKIIDTELLSF